MAQIFPFCVKIQEHFQWMQRYNTEFTAGGGGGERRGLGPRNDVLTTCKAVTLSDGQRIIAVFFPQ